MGHSSALRQERPILRLVSNRRDPHSNRPSDNAKRSSAQHITPDQTAEASRTTQVLFYLLMTEAPVVKHPTPTDEELLEELRVLLAKRGKLTMSLIEASQGTRHPNAYIRRFGSLTAAYVRIGYEMNERQGFVRLTDG